MTPRIALFAFVATVAVLHGVVSWISPLGSDDWDHVMWASQYRREGIVDWLAAFFKEHFTFSDIAGYLVARSTIVHAIVTPLVGLALLWGTFVLALRRRPRFDDWSDVVGVVLIAALIWITAPRAGLVLFHRPHVATWLYGTTLAVWFFVPLRCGMRPRGALAIALAIGGFVLATSTRQLGLLAIAVVVYAIAKTPRAERVPSQWMTLACVVAGTTVGFVDKLFDFRGYKPTFERSLEALNLPIHEGGELVTLVLCLVLLKFAIATLWPRHAGAGSPDTGEALPWLGVWFGYVLIALLGPRYTEATLFPASLVLVVGVYPYVRWLMTSRPLHLALLVMAFAINVIAWSMTLATYVPLASEFRERMATLEAAPRDSVVTVRTYSQIRPGFWAFGEDWNDAARRQLIAAEVYRLRDIEMSPAFRRLETNPRLDIRLEAEGVTREQLKAAGAPESWASTLKAARVQFGAVVEKLRATVKTPFAARLVVPLELDVLRGRKLLGAAYEAGNLVTVQVRRRPPDDESRQALVVKPRRFPQEYAESYAVKGQRAEPITYGKSYVVQVLTTDLHAVVACSPQRCFLVDAFIPAL